MKTYKIILFILLLFPTFNLLAQWETTPTIYSEHFFTGYYENNLHARNVIDYKDIKGSPYQNPKFTPGKLYMKDTVVVSAPLRYNISTDEIEYEADGKAYAIGNPEFLNKVVIGNSTYVYLPFIGKGGFYKLLETGECHLLQRRTVRFKPVEYAKPIIGTVPAEFIPEPDSWYLVVDGNQAYKIVNLKSVRHALADKEPYMEHFFRQQKIKSIRKENLIKVVKYYNSLKDQ